MAEESSEKNVETTPEVTPEVVVEEQSDLDEFLGLEATPAEDKKSEEDPADKASESKTDEEKEAESKAAEKTDEEKKKDESENKDQESKKESPDDDDKGKSDEKKDTEKSVLETELESKLTVAESRRTETQKWGNEKSSQVAELTRINAALEKKLADPDYDPATDPDLKAQDEADKSELALQTGRAEASLQASYDKLGIEKTNELMGEFREVFGTDRATQLRVRAAEMPVQAALEVLNMSKFFSKYGDNTDKIVDNIRVEVTKELTPKIREEEKKKLLDAVKKKANADGVLNKVKGHTTKADQKPKEADTSLEAEFG